MTPKLRQQLDQIDEWLTEDGGGELWDVLTALRGPDSGEALLKARTTNHIRRRAFPKMAAQTIHEYPFLNNGAAASRVAASRAILDTVGEFPAERSGTDMSHFDGHITAAVFALR